jgi:hypothetical protein
MEKKKKQELKFVSHPIRQLVWTHTSRWVSGWGGLQYSHLLSAIQILRKIVGETIIKEHYEKSYSELNKNLINFEQRVNHIIAFQSLIKKSDFRDTNFYSQRFRLYYDALQYLPLINQETTDFFMFLYHKTTLCQTTIPSEYFTRANRDMTLLTVEEERKNSSFLSRDEKRRMSFDSEMDDLEVGEEDENED